jgi:DNA replication protein DnaC
MPLQALLERLSLLRLPAFRAGLEEQLHNPKYAELTFEERLALLVDLECTRRQTNRLQRRIKAAGFPLTASPEELDFSAGRGLERRFVLELAHCDWIANHLNLIVLGPTGVGKSFLSCALGLSACRNNFTVRYYRTSRLLHQLAQAREEPQDAYPALLESLAEVDLLICDDWMRDPIGPAQAKDLLEILDDRFGRSSTLVVSQVPVADWYARFPDPTLGDAILDRLVHNAYRLNLEGDSQRKIRSALRMPST